MDGEQDLLDSAAALLDAVERLTVGATTAAARDVGLHVWAAGAALRELGIGPITPSDDLDVAVGLRFALDQLDALSFTTRTTTAAGVAITHTRSALAAWTIAAA